MIKINTTKTPLSYYGGKQRLAPFLVPLMSQHEVYVEGFGGGCALLYAKPKSRVEVYNDIDANVVNFFSVLRGDKGDELIRKLRLTPHARDEHACCKRGYKDIADEVERARCYYVLIQQSYQQIFCDSYQTGKKSVGTRWKNKTDALDEAVNRLRSVQIENMDFEKLIEKYDGPDTLFYLDPPYLPSTRTSHSQGSERRKYDQEMAEEEHVRLLDAILEVEGKVMLSGYPSKLYDKKLKGWRKWTKEMQTPSGTAKNVSSETRIETVWMNYEAPKGDDEIEF